MKLNQEQAKEFVLQSITAWNETYGKGINPESVPRMYEVLTQVSAYLAATPEWQALRKSVKEVLTASKLKL
jgi:hypothetical protein